MQGRTEDNKVDEQTVEQHLQSVQLEYEKKAELIDSMTYATRK